MYKMHLKVFLAALIAISDCICSPFEQEHSGHRSQTVITANKSYIELGIVNKQHHLYIGRCKPGDVKFHGENIILNNNGDSHVNAVILINVEDNVYITCVNVYDQVPNGDGGYPSYIDGGVGHNFVKFEVATNYGKGFNFYVEIYGYYLK